MHCNLCGYEFEKAQLSCHPSCPLGSRCNLICCPNCGYQVVDESRSAVATWLRRWLPRQAAKIDEQPEPRFVGNLLPLSHIAPGEEVEVRSFDPMPPTRLARLSLFGLVPGSRVRVVQRSPVPVLTVGETELSLGHEILDQIWVRTHLEPQ